MASCPDPVALEGGVAPSIEKALALRDDQP